jgi:hypothetical protein
MPDGVISERQAARILHVSMRRIARLRRKLLARQDASGRWRYDRNAVEWYRDDHLEIRRG